jgi:hypothetical protein
VESLPERQSSTLQSFVQRGSGLYDRTGTDSEEYLYEAGQQLEFVPTSDELIALKGTRKRYREGSRTFTRKTPSYLYLPLVVDTEYQTLPNPDTYPDFYEYILERAHRIGRGSIPLTVQANTIRPTGKGIGVFVHPLFKTAFPKARPELESPANPIAAYLQRLFPKAGIEEVADLSNERLVAIRQTRVLRLDLYAHFAVADLWKIWPDGAVHDHLLDLARREEFSIDQGRRLKVERETKFRNGRVHRSRWESVPALVRINGVSFALEISVVDTSAMAGQAGLSLAGFHACAGVAMAAKDNYSRAQKETMLLQFAAACDPVGIENGVYAKVETALPGKLDEALIACRAYSTGNLFIDYAEGDVDLYSAVKAFSHQFFALYKSLGLDPYFRPPRFTVGSTVHDLLQAAVFSLFENGAPLSQAERKFVIENGFEPARARGLSEGASWAAANARVFGGRVLSTAPTLVSRKGASICDMDLAGAYAAAMRGQILPIGRPVIDLKFPRKSNRNAYPTLGEYLAKYEGEFVPGCWQLLFSVEHNGKPLRLPTPQDFFTSWDTPSTFDAVNLEDQEPGVWLERSDEVQAFTHEIVNTVLTQDGLEWLQHCATRELREFILKHGRVKAALYYPRSRRIRGDDPQEFLAAVRQAQGDGRKNTSEVHHGRRHTEVRMVEREFHGWMGITVGQLITASLDTERGRWKKFTREYDLLRKKGIDTVEGLDKLTPGECEHFEYLATEHEGGHPGGAAGLIEASIKSSKHPKDELAKLCANTVYGDLVSRFFALSNPCVGNNITAKVRSIIWYFEKACRSWNSITDGGLFDLNEVHAWKPGRRGGLNEANTTFALQAGAKALSNDGIYLRPLGYANEDPVLSWGWDGDRVVLTRQSGRYELEVSAAQEIVNRLTLEHVQNSFNHRISVINPKVSPFEFEAKGIVQDAAIHGTANYCLRGGKHGAYKEGKDWTIKLRSYPASTHETVLKPFFDQLIDNPEAVDRSRYWKPFALGTVVKVRKYRDGFSSFYSDSIVEPGDTEYAVKVFREFTPSAFRFESKKQAERFNAFHHSRRDLGNHRLERLGSAKGQSIESFFINPDGTLNYRKMMLEAEAAIRQGRDRIHPELEVEQHPTREAAIGYKRKLWRDLVKKDRRYTETADFEKDSFDLDEYSYFTDDMYF